MLSSLHFTLHGFTICTLSGSFETWQKTAICPVIYARNRIDNIDLEWILMLFVFDI